MFVVSGESLIDLVSQPVGPDGIVHMEAHQGGSPYNCAIALAKLGNETGFLCPISKDGFGDYLLLPLDAAGVKPLLEERAEAPSTLAVVTLNQKGQAQYEFYRGADRDFTLEGLIAGLPEKPALFQIGGFCPIEPEDAAVWLPVAKEAAARGAVITMDPNLRPSLVSDFEGYKKRLSKFLDLTHLIKLSDEDLALLDPDLSIEEHAAALLAKPNCALLIVTFGEEGSRAFTAAGEGKAGIYSPAVFGDTVGAGDSLMAGVVTYLCDHDSFEPAKMAALREDTLSAMLHFGATVAGLNCAQKGCNPPTRADVDELLASL